MDNGTSSYRRFLDGEESGLIEIIRDYKDGLILYLNSFVGNIHIAEELTEDTFVKLGTKKPKDNGKSSFKTWLYTIGRNTAIDYLRHNSRVPEVPLDDYRELESEEESLEASYIREERKITVHKALEKLKPEYRQILWLVYFENFSSKQAAIVMKKASIVLKLLYTGQKNRSNQNLIRRALSMKNYNEMAESVFRRINEYETAKKKRQKTATRILISLSCLCLAVLTGAGIWIGSRFNEIPFSQGNSLLQKKTSDGQGVLIVNQVNSPISADYDAQISSYGKSLENDSLEAFKAYTGISYENFTAGIPDIWECEDIYSLSTINYTDAEHLNEYHIHDYVFTFCTEAGGKATISLCPTEKPLQDCIVICDNPKESEIHGIPLTIYGFESGYMVQFSYQNINYDIEVTNISLEELENLLLGIFSIPTTSENG